MASGNFVEQTTPKKSQARSRRAGLPFSLSHALSLFLSFSHSLTLSLFLSFSLSLTLSLSLSLSLSLNPLFSLPPTTTEGGVDAALDAIPILHDSTDAYISALALNSTSKDWGGLSAATAALIAKNYTSLEESDPLGFKPLGKVVEAKLNNTRLPIDPFLLQVEDKLVSDFNNGGQQKLSALADAATFGKAGDAALIQELNDRFGKYNVEFT